MQSQNNIIGTREVVWQLKALAALADNLDSGSAPTRQFTVVCNSSSWGSGTFFQPPSHTCYADIHADKTLVHIK